jgi:pimeloyl-ACP methyl ester carboxylesterase
MQKFARETMNRYLMRILPLLLILSVVSCVPATKVPIESVSFERSQQAQRRTLVVFLPGRGSAVRGFAEEGLVQELLRKRANVDVIGVEAHLGYYRDRTLPVRLNEDIIAPAKRNGYDNIWLVGVSLGGLGAMIYDATYPEEVTGICLLAPYLGEGSLLEEIAGAGGLAKWQPGALREPDVEREIWQKLASYAAGTKSAGRVYLGYGDADGFAVTNRFFGSTLPSGQVMTAQGGHDWQTWRALWSRMLDNPSFLKAVAPL